MKNFFIWLGISILGFLLIVGAWATHEWKAEKPFSFNNFLNRSMVKEALNSPQILTSIGVLDGLGITGHNAHLDDASEASSQAGFERLEKVRVTLLEYSDDELTESEMMSKEVALYLLNMLDDYKKFQYHNYPFNHLSGVQSQFPSFMDGQHVISNEESVEHYISRLSESTRFFEQTLGSMRIREEMNIFPPTFVIERVLDEMRGFINKPAQDNILYTSLAHKISNSTEISETKKQDLLAKG